MSGINPCLSTFTELEKLPRRRLASFPTPLCFAPELGQAIGLSDLWLKRDDLISFGFGGNKVRGLEFLIADALAHDADVIVTGAGTQSNHVRATAAAAAWAGLEAIAVYWGREPATADGNFALTRLLGAQIRFTDDNDRASIDAQLERVAAELCAKHRRPYVIPRGGACGLGVVGHILAVAELATQCQEYGITPDVVVLAVGSGGTYAGWLVGIKALCLPWRLEGVTVSRPADEARQRVVTLATDGANIANIDVRVLEADVVIHDGFLGPGYGVPTQEGRAAISIGARRQGVFFDPTYTGKAFAALMHWTTNGHIEPAQTVVFVHTGGQPTLLANALPER